MRRLNRVQDKFPQDGMGRGEGCGLSFPTFSSWSGQNQLLFSELFGVVFQSYLAYSGGPLQREPSGATTSSHVHNHSYETWNSLYRAFSGSTFDQVQSRIRPNSAEFDAK
jgi:hypothetical protein